MIAFGCILEQKKGECTRRVGSVFARRPELMFIGGSMTDEFYLRGVDCQLFTRSDGGEEQHALKFAYWKKVQHNTSMPEGCPTVEVAQDVFDRIYAETSKPNWFILGRKGGDLIGKLFTVDAEAFESLRQHGLECANPFYDRQCDPVATKTERRRETEGYA